MPESGPNFSPYPFARLRRVTRRDAAFESALARWCRARGGSLAGGELARLVGAPVRARIAGTRGHAAPAPSTTALTMLDPNAAIAEVRAQGHAIHAVGPSHAIRELAQRVLGGPDELAAPRPLTRVEQSLWSLAVAAALADLGIAAEVWPALGAPSGDRIVVEIVVELGGRSTTVIALCPPGLGLAMPPPAPLPRWPLELAVVVARSTIPRGYLRVLRADDIVTVERTLELVLGESRIGLSAAPRAMEATVATGYVPRDMALPDDAHLEMTVELGKVRLSLQQLADLAPGQIIPLGRPLAGPYEVRAGGRLMGHGELVDVEGELGVRIVSLVEE